MKPLLRFTQPHQPTDACADFHCYSHNVDELRDRVYLVCGECFHAYPTARALRAAHRRRGRQVGLRMPWWRFTPARRIWSCPECSHDF